MTDLALRLGKTPMEAERLVEAAISDGYARGFIDRPTNTFRREALGHNVQTVQKEVTRERVLIRCKFCDGLNEQGVAKCASCGASLA